MGRKLLSKTRRWQAKEIQKADKDIANSYNKYQEVYHSIPLNFEMIKALGSLRNNLWISYLLESFNKDIGWIDFEKEISTVIQCFQEFFAQNQNIIVVSSQSPFNSVARYVLQRFGFYLGETRDDLRDLGFREVSESYLIEYPKGSKSLMLNKEKIIKVLEDSLQQLIDGLKFYLYIFVEKVVASLNLERILKPIDLLSNMDSVITFNYTNTYEKIYSATNVCHIHGNIKDNIVLGINPNTDEKIEQANIDFIGFKKYYQRVFYKTDVQYLETIKAMKQIQNSHPDITLTVMGHSLDITDSDVISELFRLSGKIQILYHDKTQISKYISNLVSIFGKETFDNWRLDKDLEFIPLPIDTPVDENEAENLAVAKC